MLENALRTLVRSTLLDGLTLTGAGFTGIDVRIAYQPATTGTPSAPFITMQTVGHRRYGALKREALPDTDPIVFRELQWWETTFQIGAQAHRDPNDPDFLTLPSADDICKAASDILQGDRGLALLGVQRVRPLRVTDLRYVQFVNESDQYEAFPSFDITFSHPQVIDRTTPTVVKFEPVAGHV